MFKLVTPEEIFEFGYCVESAAMACEEFCRYESLNVSVKLFRDNKIFLAFDSVQ